MDNQQLVTFLLHIGIVLVQEIILPWRQLTTYDAATRGSITEAPNCFVSTFEC